MVKIYESKEARDTAWKTKHSTEHPGCNFFMPECEFYTDADLISYAYGILDETENYSSYFKAGSMWADGNVFEDTRKDLIESFHEIDEMLQDSYLSRESLLGQYRSDLLSHLLERGQGYDAYDTGNRIHAGTPTVDVHQDPLFSILLDRIQKSVMFLMSREQNVSKYV